MLKALYVKMQTVGFQWNSCESVYMYKTYNIHVHATAVIFSKQSKILEYSDVTKCRSGFNVVVANMQPDSDNTIL